MCVLLNVYTTECVFYREYDALKLLCVFRYFYGRPECSPDGSCSC